LVVARRDFPVIPLATLIDKVEHTANESLRISLGMIHEMRMYRTYNDLSKREESFLHAEAAYRFNPKLRFQSCNNIGYVLFAADELDKAEFLFNRAINLSEFKDSEEPYYPALPTYNIGVLRAERGQLKSALADFQICFNLAQGLNAEDRALSWLWVPVVDNEALIFEERRNPNLLETVEEAKAAIEYMMAKKAAS
jgi:tetratricopeptide (TPR) repeat protein